LVQKNLILGAFNNYEYSQLAPWVNSIKAVCTNVDVAVVVFNASFETVDRLVEKGITVIACEKDDEKEMYTHTSKMAIHVERFFHFFNILKDRAVNYDKVMVTDMKDVVFQRDPFGDDFFGKQTHEYSRFFAAGTESLYYKDEEWGSMNLEQCFGPFFHDYFKNREIVNVGVIVGDSLTMRDICLNIFLMSTNRPYPIVDQAVFNAMVHTYPYQSMFEMYTPEDDFVIHLGTTMDPSKINKFKPNLIWDEPKLENGIVVNSEGKPYAIVHQWDRVPELRELYINKYNY
jgi:hypothetical protein